MLPNHIEQNLLRLTSAIDRALKGDASATAELQAWADDNSADFHSLADAISNLVASINENVSSESAQLQAATREQELSDLYDVSIAITSRLDFDDLITTLEDKIHSLLDADTCSLMLINPQSQYLRIIGPGFQLTRHNSISGHIDVCEFEAAHVAATGDTRFVNNVPCYSMCRYKNLRCDSGVHHMLSVPMKIHGRIIGAINAFRLNKAPFDSSDERKLLIIASAAAIAIENADAYRRERDMADKLQLGIQPGSGFVLPGFQVGCNYIPATTGSRVGGDFYDIVDLGEGKYGIVIADISGKGIDAAIYTAMVRFTLRGLMLSGLSPEVVLERLNNAVYNFVPDDIFVTLFYGVLDTRLMELTYANAGHDQPLVFTRKHKCCIECDVTGRALGMIPHSSYASRRVIFEPDDMIIFFTDGITEARNGGTFFGHQRLKRIITDNHLLDACDLVEEIFTKVKSFANDNIRDDACVLAIKAIREAR